MCAYACERARARETLCNEHRTGRKKEIRSVSEPVLPHLVTEGDDYWASWGSKGWTAVKVLQVKTKYAVVQRIDPLTGEVRTAEARVKVDELVKRSPALTGTDKPSRLPSEVFAQVRLDRQST